MGELNTEKDSRSDRTVTRSDLDGEEYRDASFYKPISTREYFALLGYCTFGLVVVGLSIGVYFSLAR